jgi:anti-anti-sigma factor
MSQYQHFELLSDGPLSRVRLVNHWPFRDEDLAKLTSEWNAVADSADCRTLWVDCSNVELLNSDMLSKLILLQRRLKQKKARLVLSGLRDEIREILRWTKLDRYFEIKDQQEQEAAALL